MATGAAFGGITLIGIFALALIAGLAQPRFICSSFQLLAAVFAFGIGLSASFLGGGAAAQGTGRIASFSWVIGLTGGVVVPIVAFMVFSAFGPQDCSLARIAEEQESDINILVGTLDRMARRYSQETHS